MGRPFHIHHTSKCIHVVPSWQWGGHRSRYLHLMWVPWHLQGLGTPDKWDINIVILREFFGQGWMKLEKNERTPYIMKNTKHFNDVSAATEGVGSWAKTGQCSPPSAGQGLGCTRCICPNCAQ